MGLLERFFRRKAPAAPLRAPRPPRRARAPVDDDAEYRPPAREPQPIRAPAHNATPTPAAHSPIEHTPRTAQAQTSPQARATPTTELLRGAPAAPKRSRPATPKKAAQPNTLTSTAEGPATHVLERMLNALQPEERETGWSPTATAPFHLHGGKTLYSLADLRREADQLTEKTYQHHVTASRNDFADWIRACMDEPELADAVAKSTDLESFRKALKQPLKEPDLPQQQPPSRKSAPRARPDKDKEPEAAEAPDTERADAYRGEIAALREQNSELRRALTEEIAASLSAIEHEHRIQQELREELRRKTEALQEQHRHPTREPAEESEDASQAIIEIQARIADAKEALEENDTARAKRLYGEIREAFYNTLPEHAREELYHSVRALYTDIELASLS